MKKYFLLLLLFLFTAKLFAQSQASTPFYFPFTTQQNRAKLYKQMIDTSIRMYLSDPIADSTEGEWNEAFWSIELIAHKSDFVKQKLTQSLKKADSLSEYFQKNLIVVCYAVYPTQFKNPVQDLLSSTTSI